MPYAVTDEDLERAAELIRAGRLVAFPTETVYGLGAHALDRAAVARIYAAKGRPSTSPLIVHVASEDAARSLADSWSDTAHRLAQAFWPGPLTIVVPKRPVVPDILTAGLDTVGLRRPAHPLALRLLLRAGVPIAAPSANRWMQLSPTTAEHVRTGLGEAVDMVLDGGPTTVGIESTVISLAGVAPVLLRPGMIDIDQLEAVLGSIKIGAKNANSVAAQSPGMHPRHYAPRTRFLILQPDQSPPGGKGRILQMPADPQVYAASLYAELHRADGEGWDWIAVYAPPPEPAWAAIIDRLTRASTPGD